MEKRIIVTTPGAREKFERWISYRGGVQVWNNINLSNPDGGPMFTPAMDEVSVPEENGGINMVPHEKPHWTVMAGEIVTDIDRFRFVKKFKEVKRFHVGIRPSSNGLGWKVTDGGTRRIRAACAKYPGSFYRFDYTTQDVIIEVPEYED